jgi:hypothetical protein
VIFSSAVLLFVVKVLLFSVGKFVGKNVLYITVLLNCKICSLRSDSDLGCFVLEKVFESHYKVISELL